MKFQFKIQGYQTSAVRAVADCFAGQRRSADPIVDSNDAIQLNDAELLENIRQVQSQQGLPQSQQLIPSRSSSLNLDVEMETGTGKTYCYIKTMFELQQRFGWNKFVVVVPSIAIREGVLQSFRITTEHFLAQYGHRARTFIYSSQRLHALESFATDAGLQVMIINVQAFNAFQSEAKLAAARVIFSERDEFQSRRPIDVLKATRPILILDEPQRMGGERSTRALAEFDPLMSLRYSATHKVEHNKVFRLDAVDAYSQKLVKKIAVRGFSAAALQGGDAYLYLESIRIRSGKPPAAILHWEQITATGIRRICRIVKQGSDLWVGSNKMEAYKGWVVSDVDARGEGVVEFSNGQRIPVGSTCGNASDDTLRRLQIREAIKAHIEKEQQLHSRGIKVLKLFFIDAVANYRCYDEAGGRVDGRYAELFETEYAAVLAEYRSLIDDQQYITYIDGIDAASTHCGYFSIDKRTQRFVDSRVTRTGEVQNESEDVSAYDLILKDKERLLSIEEPTRFLFTHSALREGWDNPNVFVIGMLKPTDYRNSPLTRRQEVGRGLRICVDQQGRRVDDPTIVHDVNVLTVVANESFDSFVFGLQREMQDSMSTERRGGRSNENPVWPLPDNGRDPRGNLLNQTIQERAAFQKRWDQTKRLEICQGRWDSELFERMCVKALEQDLHIGLQHYVVQQGEQQDGTRGDGGESQSGFVVAGTITNSISMPIASGVRYDLIGRIENETQLTRPAIVRILSGISPSTFEGFRRSPEAFITQASRIICQQLATHSLHRDRNEVQD